MRHVSILFILLLMLPTLTSGASSFRQEMIRVSLVKNADSLRLGGNGLLASDEAGEPIRLSFPLELRRVKGGIAANGRVLRGLKVSAPAFVLVNGKGYRGVVEISPLENGLQVINELPLEEYLVGLINCEISSQWPMEAVKAQAVIARSYALYQREARKKAPYHLESTVIDQVYEGCDIEDSRAERGVKETAGEVLSFGGAVIQAFYHSNCGGHTEASENVWSYSIPYLQGVSCSYCQSVNPYHWELQVPLKKIEAQLKAAGYNISGLRDIRAGSRNRSGRLSEVVLVSARGRVTVPAVSLRKALGYSVIKSTNFDVSIVDSDALFSGKGYGHGVGLCQWGAKQRAADGFSYREILAYYYPGTRLETIPAE